jgi:hypothetical protein
MPRFELIEVQDAPASSRWSIQQMLPGERPIPVPFFGRRSDAGAAVYRLNGGGKVGDQAPPTWPARKRR